MIMAEELAKPRFNDTIALPATIFLESREFALVLIHPFTETDMLGILLILNDSKDSDSNYRIRITNQGWDDS